MKYEWFIGLRYLKAKRKQTFISIITIISVIGVMVGVMALIVVLSVMSGFEKTLKEKIHSIVNLGRIRCSKSLRPIIQVMCKDNLGRIETE